jgi:hypothetical protein
MSEQEPMFEEPAEEHIPHDPTPTYEQLAIMALVDELYNRLRF